MGNKKCKNKTVIRFKNKARLKNNLLKRKRSEAQNMSLSQTSANKNSKFWRNSLEFLMNSKNYFMSENQLVPKEKSFWFQKVSENSLRLTNSTKLNLLIWDVKFSKKENNLSLVMNAFIVCAKKEFITFCHWSKKEKLKFLLNFSRKYCQFIR